MSCRPDAEKQEDKRDENVRVRNIIRSPECQSKCHGWDKNAAIAQPRLVNILAEAVSQQRIKRNDQIELSVKAAASFKPVCAQKRGRQPRHFPNTKQRGPVSSVVSSNRGALPNKTQAHSNCRHSPAAYLRSGLNLQRSNRCLHRDILAGFRLADAPSLTSRCRIFHAPEITRGKDRAQLLFCMRNQHGSGRTSPSADEYFDQTGFVYENISSRDSCLF